MRKHKNVMMVLALLTMTSILLAACQPQTVIQTVEVTKEVEVPVVQTQVVVETQVQQVEAGAYTEPHPLLSDLRVRQGIAYCTNRDELIASVYPFIEDKSVLNMNTFIPRNSWANYDGDELVKYPFDPAKGAALFEEAGWTLAEGAPFRANANGDGMSLKFTTTNAAFRVTWAAVFESNMADCGLQVVRLHAPASWWFGDTTGLARRDYELGAFAWVGQSDPGGQTLYACDQIPFPENGWVGQNAMGWCNQVASDNIKLANNTLDRAERIEAYKKVQVEFSKDMVSLPLFNRAEVAAANPNLANFSPNTTEYYTWNADTWELPGADTVVLAFSQEPASMYTLVESAAVQRSIMALIYGGGGATLGYTSLDYDFQPALFELSTLESGLASNNDVEVKEGDPVLDALANTTDPDTGELLTLKPGLKVKNAAGEEVEYTGGTVTMKQLVVTYKLTADNITWSDGEPLKKADFELAYKNDCDKTSGATTFITCESIQSVDFTSDTEYTVTYKPGYQAPLYFLAPIGWYPSHQVLTDGRTLGDVPAADWATLPEIAECPLGVGPYVLSCDGGWEKGVKLTLTANPNYYKGADTLKVQTIVVTIVQDTNQAVAQLLTGEADAVGSETLGAGQEVQVVIDAQAEGKAQVVVEPSATWEHIDMQLFLP
jgi:ABC-type transport system substrate-binding protein